MSRDKLILSGAVLLGLLGFLVFKQAKRDDELGRPSVATADLPTISASDDVDKISITNGDKGEVVLEKQAAPGGAAADGGADSLWVLTKPVLAKANQQTIKDLIGNLKDLKVDSQVDIHLDDQVKKDKQLDTAHGLHLVAWKGGTKVADELFGKSGAVGQLVVVTQKPDLVWAAKGYSSYLYAKEAKDFRDKEIFKFDDANATQVTVANTHGTFTFTKSETKDGKWLGTSGAKPIERFDSDKVKDLLRAYKALNADDFGDGKGLEDTGLDKPTGQVTIHLRDDAKDYELVVGNISSGTNRWAKRADSDAIYQITNYAAEWATADTSKYQAAADAGAGDGGAKGAAMAKIDHKK